MLKILTCLLLLIFSGDLFTCTAGASGYRGSAGHSGSRGDYQGAGKAYHRSGGRYHGGGHHGSHGHQVHRHYHGHRGHHGHGSSYRIWIGPGWRPGWWGSAYPCYRYYSYYQPPVVIPGQPQLPEPSQEQETYWYYCEDPQGYYPYVKSCPGGWMKVVPEPIPPDSR